MDWKRWTAAAFPLTMLAITIAFAAQDRAFSNEISRDEREQFKSELTMQMRDSRREWLTTALGQYDKYAASHMMMPITVAVLSGSVANGLLAAYLYETWSLLEDLYWNESKYMLRYTDALVQDPALAIIAILLVPMSWRKKQFKEVYAIGSVVAAIVGTMWVGPINNALNLLQDYDDPMTEIFAVRYPVGLLMAYAVARHYNATNAINALKRLARLWLCILVGSLISLAGFNNGWRHPFQSSAYWISLILTVHYVTVVQWTTQRIPKPRSPAKPQGSTANLPYNTLPRMLF